MDNKQGISKELEEVLKQAAIAALLAGGGVVLNYLQKKVLNPIIDTPLVTRSIEKSSLSSVPYSTTPWNLHPSWENQNTVSKTLVPEPDIIKYNTATTSQLSELQARVSRIENTPKEK